MKTWLARIVRGTVTGFCLLSALLVLLVAAVSFLLWRQGRLSPERVSRAVRSLRGQEEKASPIPPGIAAQEWDRIRKAHEQQEENLVQRGRELSQLQDLATARLEQLTRERGEQEEARRAIDERQAAFERTKQEWTRQQEDATFRSNVKRYQEAPAKAVVQLWEILTDEEIIRYFRAMRPDGVAGLLKEMLKSAAYTARKTEVVGTTTEERPSRLEAITKLMQQK